MTKKENTRMSRRALLTLGFSALTAERGTVEEKADEAVTRLTNIELQNRIQKLARENELLTLLASSREFDL